ncbi:HMA2 domain-containing protein [Nostoc sp. 106C]|uniref:HMA2 domain-containing protein n=1 Tax=Nostoc sp. 106C TaxID=1932667 RepID=UPI000A384A77|nr:hypothetical protein [Nostoc sp. 106C]OUL28063.1 hypothetical protein BV375_18890 [Nostoc sp. 106C]
MTNTISSRDRLSPQPQESFGLISAQSESDEGKLNTDSSVTEAQSKGRVSLGGWRIVHASNGRVRIRAQESCLESRLEAISQYLEQQNGVKEAIVNQQTGSLAIVFDPNQLPLPQILEKLEEFGINLISTDESNIKADLFAEWKSVDFWKQQTISLIPLMTGLAVTGGLGISGVASIPVYMIAANATRWVIGSIESEISGAETSTSKSTQASSLEIDSKSASSDKIAYSVVHTIPGRIRLHLPLIAKNQAYGRRLERQLKTDAQVTSVRINYSAASVAIAYQPSEISLAHWVKLMELALQTHPPNNPIKTTEQQPLAEQVIQPTEVPEDKSPEMSIWANMKPNALSYCLAFMANFPLGTFPE